MQKLYTFKVNIVLATIQLSIALIEAGYGSSESRPDGCHLELNGISEKEFKQIFSWPETDQRADDNIREYFDSLKISLVQGKWVKMLDLKILITILSSCKSDKNGLTFCNEVKLSVNSVELKICATVFQTFIILNT